MTTTLDQWLNQPRNYSTREDAKRDARQFIWGDVPISKREYVTPETRPDVALYVNGFPYIIVSANVNGWLYAFEFDSFGRLLDTTKVGKI